MRKSVLQVILILAVFLFVTGLAFADEYEPVDTDKDLEPGWHGEMFKLSDREPEQRILLSFFPSAFGLEQGDGYAQAKQARVFISSAGGKKRRATENYLDMEFAVTDDWIIRAAKRFSTLSGSTSVIKLESTSFGAQYRIKSKPDIDSRGFHRDKTAMAAGFHYDMITADPFVIDDVPILLADAKTWGIYLNYAQKTKKYDEWHYIAGYARNKMASGRGQCVYAGLGYVHHPTDKRFRWGINGKLFKDFEGMHATGIGQGIYSLSDGLNLEMELGLTLSGPPMTGAYFSDAAAISMNFKRESSFQNVKDRSYPYAVLALKYNF